MNTDKPEKSSSLSTNVLFSLAKQFAAPPADQRVDDVAGTATGEEATSGKVSLESSETIISVKAGGINPFLGQVRFKWKASDDQVLFEKVEYRIDRGSNAGGNKANVYIAMFSGGVHGFETDQGFQDNAWRTLSSNFGVPRSNWIILSCRFVFDRSNHPDPEGSQAEIIYP
jgi:hypothetical protein